MLIQAVDCKEKSSDVILDALEEVGGASDLLRFAVAAERDLLPVKKGCLLQLHRTDTITTQT